MSVYEKLPVVEEESLLITILSNPLNSNRKLCYCVTWNGHPDTWSRRDGTFLCWTVWCRAWLLEKFKK